MPTEKETNRANRKAFNKEIVKLARQVNALSVAAEKLGVNGSLRKVAFALEDVKLDLMAMEN